VLLQSAEQHNATRNTKDLNLAESNPAFVRACSDAAKFKRNQHGGLSDSLKAKRAAGKESSGNWTCGKRKREVGRAGGQATGVCKQRHGVENGRTKVVLERYQMWKPIHMRFDVFSKLLEL